MAAAQTTMGSGPSEAELRRQRMIDSISPLVDSLSTLILCAVSGDMQLMKSSIEDIAKYTNSVVEAARDIAVASKEASVQLEMSKSINGVADAVNQLVTAFTNYLTQRTNLSCQKAFATATKDVGDAINALVVAADESSLTKLFQSIQGARESCDDLLQQAHDQHTMLPASKRLGQALLQLVDHIQSASTRALDVRKGQSLLNAEPQIKAAIAGFIRSAAPYPDPSDPTFRGAYNAAVGELDQLLALAKVPPDYSKGFHDAYDSALAQLSDLASALSKFSRQLYDLLLDPNHSHADFVEAAAKTARTAKAFLNQAAKALEKITDPGRRRMIEALMKDISTLSADIVRTAQALQADPTNQALREKLAALNNALDSKLAQLLTLISEDGKNSREKLDLSSKYLDELVRQLADNVGNYTPEQLAQFADAVQQLTVTVANDAKAAAVASDNDDDRNRILATLPPLVGTCKALVGTTRALAAAPGDPALLQRFGGEKDAFADAIYDVRVAAHLDLPRVKNVPPPPVVPEVNDDHELVRAAANQASAALALAARAREFAETVSDPAKRARILDAAALLERLAGLIVEKARHAARNPNDAQAQKDLDDTQRLLADAIRAIVELTAGKGSSLADLLREMELSAGGAEDDTAIFLAVDELLAEIDRFTKNLADGLLSPQELVAQARSLAQRAADLAKLLLQLAARTDDRALQAQLKQTANILRDKGVQIKMLAAVEVAGGGSGSTGQVSSSVHGLKGEVSETARILRVAALKRRVHRTNKQTEFLRRLLGAWNDAHNLVAH